MERRLNNFKEIAKGVWASPLNPVECDNSDYSNLSNPKVLEKAPIMRDTLNFLYKCVEKDVIEIRFSAITVAEITHIDEGSRPYAVQRAKILMELTRGKTIRPIFDLFTEDAIYLGIKGAKKSTARRFPNYAYLENNDWIDKTRWPDFTAKLKIEALEQCKQIVKSLTLSLPRPKRKEIEKFLFGKGKITSDFARLLLEYYNADMRRIKNEFIFWQEFTSEEMLIGFLSGKVSDKLFTDILLKNVMDVEFFISKICDYEPKIRETFVSFIKGEGYRLIEKLKTF